MIRSNPVDLSFVSAVNNDEILRSCLLSSPDAGAFGELILQRGYDSAATAYNAAIEVAKHDVIVFIHQDVYLPAGWLTQLTSSIEHLQKAGQDWAVLGLFGMTSQGEGRGHLYCVANGKILGTPLKAPEEVVSLDEIVLVLRRSSGVRFDSRLPGYHFYGTDLSLNARAENFKVFVVPGFCIHNSNEYGMFPNEFWEGYRFMRRKWRALLPVRTPCLEIQRSWIYPQLSRLRRFLWIKRVRRPAARRVSNPAALWSQLAATRAIAK